jgi:hypothetical protein
MFKIQNRGVNKILNICIYNFDDEIKKINLAFLKMKIKKLYVRFTADYYSTIHITL